MGNARHVCIFTCKHTTSTEDIDQVNYLRSRSLQPLIVACSPPGKVGLLADVLLFLLPRGAAAKHDAGVTSAASPRGNGRSTVGISLPAFRTTKLSLYICTTVCNCFKDSDR